MPEIVIVGGGLAAARVAQSYREAGGTDAITLISADNHLPYHRPPLTKRLLRGESEPKDALVASAEDYADLNVDVRLETRVHSLDLGARELVLDGEERLGFDRLVIASGATPRRLPVHGAELEGVHVLRLLDDSLAIRAGALAAERTVIVGTGFIGMEAAASLRHLGREVTVLDHATQPFQSLGSPEFSAFLADLYRGEGVDLRLGDGIDSFVGDTELHGVRTSSGDQIDAQLAVMGVGVVPATDWLDGSGIALDNGVVVDDAFATAADGVYAVGDVARFHDPIFGRDRRIEHWSNADYQGKQLGKILAGEHAPYDRVSAFFTELFGRVFRYFGDATDTDERRLEGDFAEGAAVVRYLQDGRLRAALVTGQDDDTEQQLQQQIRAEAEDAAGA